MTFTFARFNSILHRPLRNVEVSDDKERVTFHFINGDPVSYAVRGDCCSNSWIEHCMIPRDIAGTTITAVTEPSYHPFSEVHEEHGEVIAVYHTAFRTNKGEIILEYRNSSNGYYGGYLQGPVPPLPPPLPKPIYDPTLQNLICGANSAALKITGRSVGDIRRAFTPIFNIPRNATALVNGSPVSNKHTLKDGDTLVFTKDV